MNAPMVAPARKRAATSVCTLGASAHASEPNAEMSAAHDLQKPVGEGERRNGASRVANRDLVIGRDERQERIRGAQTRRAREGGERKKEDVAPQLGALCLDGAHAV